jgi:hypothetical protein
MRRLSYRLPGPPPSCAEEPDAPDTRGPAPAVIVGEARCPRCRAHLVARMGRDGPYFPCRCPGWGGPRKRAVKK